jgi:hypothetical protein
MPIAHASHWLCRRGWPRGHMQCRESDGGRCARGELTLSMLVTESGIVTLVRLVHS